jgi:hypothetical protein
VEGLGTKAGPDSNDDLGGEDDESKSDDDYDDLDDIPESMETDKREGADADSASKGLGTRSEGNRADNSGKQTQKLSDISAPVNLVHVSLGLDQSNVNQMGNTQETLEMQTQETIGWARLETEVLESDDFASKGLATQSGGGRIVETGGRTRFW